MAFIMRYWKSWLKRAKSACWLSLCLSQSALANIEIIAGSCDFERQKLSLHANITLDDAPTEALHSGISLFFRYDIEQTSPDFWQNWFGDKALWQYQHELYYNPIARTYRLSHQGKERYYQQLDRALAALGQFNATYGNVTAEQSALVVRARLQLDTTQLPTSLRLISQFSPQWNNLHSAWWHCPSP